MRVSRNISSPNFQIATGLALSKDEVQLWRVDLKTIRSHETRWLDVLSADETNRASRFHFPTDRQNFIAARALLRTILASFLAVKPKDLIFRYSKKEKPSLDLPYAESGVMFNLSHSGGVALYAFAVDRELGVDIEHVRRDFDVEAIARRFFSAHEQEQFAGVAETEKIEACYRCWTRKEAYIKATGDGLSLLLSQFDVSIEAGKKDALISTRPDDSHSNLWKLSDIAIGPEYLAAICVRGRDWKLKPWTSDESDPRP
jgi:4'-phosphopantetheinyl transferase